MENTNGVIKKLTSAERSYYTAAEVREMMGVSRDTAYRMIRSLRSDLIADGQLAKGYPSGKIPKKAFNKLYMIECREWIRWLFIESARIAERIWIRENSAVAMKNA